MALPTIHRWQGRTALVTGAGYGIGAEICKALVQNNINVVGCGRKRETIDELATKFAKAGFKGTLYPFKCDLTKENEIEAMFIWIKSKFGGVDICINNAGFASGDSIIDCNFKNLREMFEVNVVALIACNNKALKSMEERGINDGHLININSMLGHIVTDWAPLHTYTATKFAVTAVVEGLRKELLQKKSGIRISSISPATVDTEFQTRAYGKEKATQVKSGMPTLTAKDVADAVIYTLSAPQTVQVHDILFRAQGAP